MVPKARIELAQGNSHQTLKPRTYFYIVLHLCYIEKYLFGFGIFLIKLVAVV